MSRLFLIAFLGLTSCSIGKSYIPVIEEKDKPHTLILYFNKDHRTKHHDKSGSSYRLDMSEKLLVYSTHSSGLIASPDVMYKTKLSNEELTGIKIKIAELNFPAIHKKVIRTGKLNPWRTVYFENENHLIQINWKGEAAPEDQMLNKIEALRLFMQELVEKHNKD